VLYYCCIFVFIFLLFSLVAFVFMCLSLFLCIVGLRCADAFFFTFYVLFVIVRCLSMRLFTVLW